MSINVFPPTVFFCVNKYFYLNLFSKLPIVLVSISLSYL